MGHIKRTALAESKVLVPPECELVGLTEIMQPVVDCIIESKIASKRLSELRDALLPKLMAGEIDVSRIAL